MCFKYLLLGHLLGDFTFQTDDIAENKTKQWRWNLCHSIIVTLSMLIFAIFFGPLIASLVILNGVLHFVIDYYKSKLSGASPLNALTYFLADQAVHLLIIFYISSFYNGNTLALPLKSELLDLLIILASISSCASIFIQYTLRLFFVIDKNNFFFENEKIAGIMTRILIFLILYSSIYFTDMILLVIITVLIAKTIYYRNKWHSLMIPAYFYSGLLMDLLIPSLIFCLVF